MGVTAKLRIIGPLILFIIITKLILASLFFFYSGFGTLGVSVLGCAFSGAGGFSFVAGSEAFSIIFDFWASGTVPAGLFSNGTLCSIGVLSMIDFDVIRPAMTASVRLVMKNAAARIAVVRVSRLAWARPVRN